MRLQHAAPWTSSGKRIRVQVQAWASSAVGGKLVALGESEALLGAANPLALFRAGDQTPPGSEEAAP